MLWILARGELSLRFRGVPKVQVDCWQKFYLVNSGKMKHIGYNNIGFEEMCGVNFAI